MKCYVKLKEKEGSLYWECSRYGRCTLSLHRTHCYYTNCPGRSEFSPQLLAGFLLKSDDESKECSKEQDKHDIEKDESPALPNIQLVTEPKITPSHKNVINKCKLDECCNDVTGEQKYYCSRRCQRIYNKRLYRRRKKVRKENG